MLTSAAFKSIGGWTEGGSFVPLYPLMAAAPQRVEMGCLFFYIV